MFFKDKCCHAFEKGMLSIESQISLCKTHQHNCHTETRKTDPKIKTKNTSFVQVILYISQTNQKSWPLHT